MTEPSIKVVEIKKPLQPPKASRRRRVAAYARVSTSSDGQMNSLSAQKNYYVTLIQQRPEWEFCGLYADEGISGLQRNNRVQFESMMKAALAGEFDLIVTKSISRFARNTVDTLTCIRALKASGCEVYFEKENLWTFDGKGEFMLTLLSSMAQEESRSISENVTWGIRKRFAEGQYSVAYKNFLGYDYGWKVNSYQAGIVRMIFRMAFEGHSIYGITKSMEDCCVPAPAGGSKWCTRTIERILHNEKYKGDALLQKRFTVDFLQKKMKVNEGELPQYYVSGGHEPIIPVDTFDFMQELLRHRSENFGPRYSGTGPLSSKVFCAQCGAPCRYLTSHGYDRYWACSNKLKKRSECSSAYISSKKTDNALKEAVSFLLKDRLRMIIETLCLGGLTGVDLDLEGYIAALINYPQMLLPDDVLAVITETITISPDYSLVFTAIDGTKVSVAVRRWERL